MHTFKLRINGDVWLNGQALLLRSRHRSQRQVGAIGSDLASSEL
ncbi:hypothetical protein [Chroogloeocystis siderophila]